MGFEPMNAIAYRISSPALYHAKIPMHKKSGVEGTRTPDLNVASRSTQNLPADYHIRLLSELQLQRQKGRIRELHPLLIPVYHTATVPTSCLDYRVTN